MLRIRKLSRVSASWTLMDEISNIEVSRYNIIAITYFHLPLYWRMLQTDVPSAHVCSTVILCAITIKKCVFSKIEYYEVVRSGRGLLQSRPAPGVYCCQNLKAFRPFKFPLANNVACNMTLATLMECCKNADLILLGASGKQLRSLIGSLLLRGAGQGVLQVAWLASRYCLKRNEGDTSVHQYCSLWTLFKKGEGPTLVRNHVLLRKGLVAQNWLELI